MFDCELSFDSLKIINILSKCNDHGRGGCIVGSGMVTVARMVVTMVGMMVEAVMI